MKKFLLSTILVFVANAGSCETLDFGNDLILNVTESANFRQLFIDYANRDLGGLANLIYYVATGNNIPTGGTVTVNTAQWNRWLNKTDKNSFASKAIYNQLSISIRRKEPMLAAPYILEATAQAALQLNTPAKRTRFINLLNSIYNKEEF